MPTFQQVETIDSVDHLDGKPLQHGEKLIARWGDGTSSSHTVQVFVEPTSDAKIVRRDGKRYKEFVTRSRAMLPVKHRGFDLKIPLAGSGITLARDE